MESEVAMLPYNFQAVSPRNPTQRSKLFTHGCHMPTTSVVVFVTPQPRIKANLCVSDAWLQCYSMIFGTEIPKPRGLWTNTILSKTI